MELFDKWGKKVGEVNEGGGGWFGILIAIGALGFLLFLAIFSGSGILILGALLLILAVIVKLREGKE